jgi:UDP-N-acetylmuramyl pentapeptide synthase
MQATRKKSAQLVNRVLSLVGAQELPLTAWRVARQRLLEPIYRQMLRGSASLYRRVGLHRVVFIGVTGSCGKTTTKELIAAVLASQFQGHKTPGNRNLPDFLAKSIVRVRPWDDFCVLEIAAAIRGKWLPLEDSLYLVQPQIGVVTATRSDHLSAFGSLRRLLPRRAS